MTTAAVPAVSMQGIVKRFPLVLANDHVDFEVAWGEVHALIGENGAGKSTLMKILGGVQQPDEGTILIDGKPASISSAKDAFDLGIGMVHQHFMLIEPLTVTENLILGAEPQLGPTLNLREARRKAEGLIEQFGFDIDPGSKIESLPVGLQQQVEILKTLYRGARIMIMDEPTAVLTPQETRGLFSFVREFAAAGNAVIFISHKLGEVMEICDRMSVMRDGKMIGTVTQAGTSERELANMMVGREVLLQVEKEPATPPGGKALGPKRHVASGGQAKTRPKRHLVRAAGGRNSGYRRDRGQRSVRVGRIAHRVAPHRRGQHRAGRAGHFAEQRP